MNRRQASRLLVCPVVLSLGGFACARATTFGQAETATTGHEAAAEATPGGAVPSEPTGREYSPQAVVFEIERQPDGGRYPSYVKERFALGSDSFLDYSACFGGMPIEMNHNDSVRWDAGEHGLAVFDAVRAILADPALFADLIALPDDAPDPWSTPGFYKVRVERDEVDFSYVLQERSTRAFGILDAAFGAMVSEFENSRGRPLRPGDLPQR